MACVRRRHRQRPTVSSEKTERGAVLVSALLVMVLMAALGTTAITLATFDSEISANYLSAAQSMYAAESGTKHMTALYRLDPTTFTGTQSASDMGLPTTKPGAVNLPPSFVYWISNLTYEGSVPPHYVDIESSGSVLGTPSLARITVRLAYDPVFFDVGAFADISIDFTSASSEIDSYNSCVAPYDPLNPGSNGGLATNATDPCAVDLGNNTVINGDVMVGPGGDPSTTICNGVITGSKTAMPNPRHLPAIADPGGGTLTVVSDGTTLPSGNYRLADITLSSSDMVTIAGDVTLYVESTISLSSQAEIVITPGASLTVYALGDVHIGGHGVVNQMATPQNLLIYGTPTSNTISLSGSSEFYGAVYAPHADITLGGNSEMYGAFVGKTLRLTGTTGIHYDECFGEGGGPFRVVFWRKD